MKLTSAFWLAILAVVIITAAVLRSSAAPPPAADAAKATFLERLQPGQSVALAEKDGRYEITVFSPPLRPLSHTVVEVNQRFVVLRDLAGITDMAIPIYSIKVIKTVRLPANR